MLRRVRHDVLSQLPPRTDTRVPVEMTPAQVERHDEYLQPIAQIVHRSLRRPLSQPEFLKLMSMLTMQRILCNGVAQADFDDHWPRLESAARPTPALLEWMFTPKLATLRGLVEQVVLGQPALYSTATPSPDGKYLLVEHLVGPWSHDVGWDRFASELEVWDRKGRPVASLASLPLADEVPIHGVPEGPRKVSWQTSAPHTLFWVEALDGGDPMAEVPHRDRLLRLEAPFDSDPSEVFRAEHRIRSLDWGEGDLLLLTQWERMRRWRYAWLLDLDKGSSRWWFDLSDKDRYADPGRPVYRQLANGRWVMRQVGDALTFEGSGATPEGDRPFLDLRSMSTDKVDRLFRSRADHY